MGVWDFIQNQIFGMQWLESLSKADLPRLGLTLRGAWVEVFGFLSST